MEDRVVVGREGTREEAKAEVEDRSRGSRGRSEGWSRRSVAMDPGKKRRLEYGDRSRGS
jgi:hypothetical protein